MGIDVSIIIVNYNTLQITTNCIESIFNYTKNLSFEIILVDNASIDGSKKFFEHDSRIKYIYLEENIGFGKANNVGFKFAKGRYFFCLNPDTLLINNAIKFLCNFMDENLICGACGGNLRDLQLNPIHSFCRKLPGFFTEFNQFLLGFPSKLIYGSSYMFNNTRKSIEVGYVTGADLMIRASILNEIGGFDPDFFMYYEESELQYRIKNKGYKIYAVPYAEIIHLEGKSFEFNIKREKASLISRSLYYKKTRSCMKYRLLNKTYFSYTYIAKIIAILFGMKSYKNKLSQRIKLLKEISNNEE